ncbi:hypothetical protein BGZ52_008465 [Haplosporangium bisporale]|nr:hypothetical protein BGZ52_008465 [Haplosporangium bisporale]KAF9215433.1 hypothetical protein BGZ59_001373 [Podila verticillata]KFH67783.1 hypothetical protein MVEG_06515 [Podila verticillata NRRL 6337]
MSFEPKEQPVYYSPAPAASSPAPAVVGTPTYQYDQAQQQQSQQGTPVYQYVQPSPQQPNVLQQPYYPPSELQSPPPQHQQIYYAQQPNQQPIQMQQPMQMQQPVQGQANVVYTTSQAVAAPAVTTIPISTGGTGLTRNMPQFENCCLCFPLHTGAMIITFLMVIFYGYCGLALIIDGTYFGWYNAVMIVLGILYLGVAVVSGFGFAGIYKERMDWVDRFVKMYVIGSICWLVLEIIEIIIQVVWVNNLNRYAYFVYTVPWVGWAITLIIGGLFQYYFACCLVSYQRLLHHKMEAFDGQSNVVIASGGVPYVQKDIAMA